MKHLRARDYDQIVELIGRFHSCHDPHLLREKIAEGVMALIGGDYSSFEHFAPTVPRAWAVGANGYAYEEWVLLEFSKYANEHPAVVRYQETGDLNAMKISDFVDVKSWHGTTLYQRIHRVLGIEDQLGISLGPPDEEFYSVVLSRGRRNFTERERAILNCLRPHIASAHDNSLAMDRLSRMAFKEEEARKWLWQVAILVNRKGEVDYCPAKARRWLLEFFSYEFRKKDLPTEMETWLRRNLESLSGKNTIKNPILPLTRVGEKNRLIIRFRSDPTSKKYAIVMEKQTLPNDRLLQSLGLTRRQIEVLLEVEKGKSNEDIASALFISPQTVRTHLQNIFATLGVANRTSAVSRLRQEY